MGYYLHKPRAFKMVHISQIRVGDIIERDGKETTVCKHNIKQDKFWGTSLFGDSYNAGHKLVKKYDYLSVKGSIHVH